MPDRWMPWSDFVRERARRRSCPERRGSIREGEIRTRAVAGRVEVALDDLARALRETRRLQLPPAPPGGWRAATDEARRQALRAGMSHDEFWRSTAAEVRELIEARRPTEELVPPPHERGRRGRKPGGATCQGAILREFDRLIAAREVEVKTRGCSAAARMIQKAFPDYTPKHIADLIRSAYWCELRKRQAR